LQSRNERQSTRVDSTAPPPSLLFRRAGSLRCAEEEAIVASTLGTEATRNAVLDTI